MQAAPNKADMLTSGGEAGRAEMLKCTTLSVSGSRQVE